MATILKEYPRLFSYPKGELTYYRVDLRHKDYVGAKKTRDFTTEADARAFRDEFKKTIAQDGFNAIAPLQSPRLDKLDKQCALFGHTLEEAVTVASRVWLDEVSVKQSKLMAELLLLWQADKENGRKKQRKRSMGTIKSYVKSFTAYFGNFRIREVDEEKVDAYLKSKVNDSGEPIEASTQKNHLRYLQGFFNWAAHKNFTAKTHNPANHWLKEIFVEKKPIEFYSVDKCKHICRLIMLPENEAMIGYFTLCLFCGIRPEETERLSWSNVNWDTKEIVIPAHIAKPKKLRHFGMDETCPVIYDWLTIIKNKNLPLIPEKNKRKLRYKVIHKFNFPTIHDGLRHTFATYMRIIKPKSDLTRIMGNSPSILDNHYVGGVSPKEADKFFALTPALIQAEIDKTAEVKAKVKKYLQPSAKKRVADYLGKLKQKEVLAA